MNELDLREAIDIEREEIDVSIAGVERLRRLLAAEPTPDPDRLAAISTYLHNAYTGVENVLKLISKYNAVPLPAAVDWHARLLQNFHRSGTDERLPRFLDDELKDGLDDLRGFRHVFRNRYARSITWPKLESPAGHACATIERFFELLAASPLQGG